MDVSPVEPLALPLFTPLAGFASISMPELSLTIDTIEEANALFSKKVITRGSIGAITLRRAATWFDSDFWRWTWAALQGTTGGQVSLGEVGGAVGAIGGVTPRRDLLLIQFMTRSPFGTAGTAAAAVAGTLALAGIAGGMAVAGGASAVGTFGGVGGVTTQAGAAAAAAGFGGSIGPFEIAARIPGKAWMLYGCIPSRYRPGGDFDATSSEISIAELDLEMEFFDEISLTA
jgi:hypothetical protein